MRFSLISLSLLAVVALSSSADAQFFSGKMFGRDKAAKAAAGRMERQMAVARLSERHGEIGQAAQMYRQMLKTDPGLTEVRHRLGIVSVKQGDVESAIKHLSTVASAGNPSPELLSDLGYAHYLAGEFPVAEKYLRQAVAAAPGAKAARNNLGLVLAAQGKHEAGFAQFRQAGGEAHAYANMGFVYSQLGNLKEAESCYHRALKHDPDLRPAAQALLQVTARKQQGERVVAQREAEKSVPVASVQPARSGPTEATIPADLLRRKTPRSAGNETLIPRLASSPPKPSSPAKMLEKSSAGLAATPVWRAVARPVPTVLQPAAVTPQPSIKLVSGETATPLPAIRSMENTDTAGRATYSFDPTRK